MNVKYCFAGLSFLLMSCTTQDPPKILEVGGSQLPSESASSLINKGEDQSTPSVNSLQNEPTVNYNLQTPSAPGLDALPTLVIPSPSGNKIVILPPPTR
jgi:hypothetical protein